MRGALLPRQLCSRQEVFSIGLRPPRRPCNHSCRSSAADITTETTPAVTEPALRELYCFDTSVQVLPHPEKVSFGGEDAYFIEDFGFGVADGVGGWREGGVNPADYSRQIMQITSDQVKEESDLCEALNEAHMKTRMPGSCTASLAKIDGETGTLSTLNLGDSGFVVLRNDAVMARSTPQQHFFDCPKQLAACPEHCQGTDYARDGERISLQLQEGDIIIMGTDGLWDNVYEKEILNFASNAYGRKKTVDDLSEGLARLAQRHSLDEEFVSPYSTAALAEGFDVPWYEKALKAKVENWKFEWGTLTGGKVDDITVIVARVKKSNFPLPEPDSPEE